MKKLLSAVLAACLTFSLAACGANKEDDTSSERGNNQGQVDSATLFNDIYDTQQKAIFEMDGQKYYVGGAVFKMVDDDKMELVELGNSANKSEDSESSKAKSKPTPMCLDLGWRNVISGNAAYGPYQDMSEIFRWDLSDMSNVKREVLYDTKMDQMIKKEYENNAIQYSDEDEYTLSRLLCNLKDSSDGYVYFMCIPDTVKNLSSYDSLFSYRLGRFAKDGSNIELIEDIHTCAYSLKDDYIYYYENGFNKDDPEKPLDDTGIYMVKTDGSGRKKLCDIKIPSEDLRYETISTMNIIGNDLYFIYKTSEDSSPLYKLPLGGGTPEKVTEKSCSFYYIDMPSSVLYYEEGVLGQSTPGGVTVYSQSLQGGDETKLISNVIGRSGDVRYDYTFCVDGDYLYFGNDNASYGYQYVEGKIDESEALHQPIGARYNLKTGKVYNLYAGIEVTYDTGNSGLTTSTSYGDSHVYWLENEYIRVRL